MYVSRRYMYVCITHINKQSHTQQVGLIDIETLAQICPYPWPEDNASCQILEVFTHLGHAKKGHAASQNGGMGAPGDHGTKAKKDRPVCAFKMRVHGGGDNITLRCADYELVDTYWLVCCMGAISKR